MTLGERLKKARVGRKMTQQQLAEKVGIKQQAIQRIEAGKVRATSYVVQLAEILEISPQWLAIGEGNSDPQVKVTRIPVYTWQAAWQRCSGYDTPVAPESTLATTQNLHADSFALRVDDDAMISHMGPVSFAPGDYVILDPGKAAHLNDFVIAKMSHSQELVLRQLQQNELVALNASHNNIPILGDITIAGVVVARYTLF